MDQPELPQQPSGRGRKQNTVRESDIHADPEYRQKKEFFDQLLVKGFQRHELSHLCSSDQLQRVTAECSEGSEGNQGQSICIDLSAASARSTNEGSYLPISIESRFLISAKSSISSSWMEIWS